MGVYIKGMTMPKNCLECPFMALANTTDGRLLEFCSVSEMFVVGIETQKDPKCPLIELPPHGDLIDRDALMKDGWLSLHKEVMRMGGYAIHELPLKNPTIPAIIEAEAKE